MAQPRQTTPSTGSSQHRHLRQDCLRRDGNICVSGIFNRSAAITRSTGEYLDDDGKPLSLNQRDFTALQAAHIIPQGLDSEPASTRYSARDVPDDHGPSLDSARLGVLTILDMLLPVAIEKYCGTSMDCPENAMSMDYEMHRMFRELQIYFDPLQDAPVSYSVHYVNNCIGPFSEFPKDISFRKTLGVPSPDTNLLAIHRACARVSHATRAAEACMQFFCDLEGGRVEADGSTRLDHLVAYRLGFHQNPASEQQE